VRCGDLIAMPPRDQLGAPIHASIHGTVTAIGDSIEITA